MLFVTKEKVVRQIDALLSKFEDIQSRTLAYSEQDKIIGDILGPNELVQKISGNSAKIYERLIEAKAQVRFNLRPLRDIAGNLPEVGKVAEDYNRLLKQMDAANAAGQSQASAHFGIANAANQ